MSGFKKGDKLLCIKDYSACYKNGEICKKGDVITIRCVSSEKKDIVYGFEEIGREGITYENSWCNLEKHFKKHNITLRDVLE